jgi:hypothetical protein
MPGEERRRDCETQRREHEINLVSPPVERVNGRDVLTEGPWQLVHVRRCETCDGWGHVDSCFECGNCGVVPVAFNVPALELDDVERR